MRELGKFPVVGEIRRKARTDKSFPSHTVFNRFGGKEALIEAAVAYSRDKAESTTSSRSMPDGAGSRVPWRKAMRLVRGSLLGSST